MSTGGVSYLRPQGLGPALTALADGGWRLLAGGTDLYATAGTQALSGRVIDLTAIEELRGIDVRPGGVRIGACATWSDVCEARLSAAFDGLKQAAREIGGRQIQNAGTVGGNICNASPAADGVVALLALAAEVEVASAQGVRRVALADFILAPRRVALGPGEMVSTVVIGSQAAQGRSRFLKLGARAHLVISIASVAVRLVDREGCVADVAIALGACSAVPRRLGALEAALMGLPLARVAGAVDRDLVARALDPIGDVRASADYRRTAAAELVVRALSDLVGGRA